MIRKIPEKMRCNNSTFITVAIRCRNIGLVAWYCCDKAHTVSPRVGVLPDHGVKLAGLNDQLSTLYLQIVQSRWCPYLNRWKGAAFLLVSGGIVRFTIGYTASRIKPNFVCFPMCAQLAKLYKIKSQMWCWNGKKHPNWQNLPTSLNDRAFQAHKLVYITLLYFVAVAIFYSIF